MRREFGLNFSEIKEAQTEAPKKEKNNAFIDRLKKNETVRYHIPRAKNAIEQVFIKDEQKSHGMNSGELWEKTWTGSNYDRLVSLLRLAKKFLPEQITQLDQNWLKSFFQYSEKELPFNPETYRLGSLGAGVESKVFLLESRKEEAPSVVLKVVMPDRENPTPMDQIKRLKGEYEHIRDLYADVNNFVPEEHFLILDDPADTGRPAAGMIQPFAAGEIKDLFDFSINDLKKLTDNNSLLSGQLKDFSRITLSYYQSKNEIIDLRGTKNVSIVGQEAERRLMFLDPHVIYSADSSSDLEKIKAFDHKIEFLKKILEILN